MILDAYLFNGEWEMEDLRRRTLAGTVDGHVAVVCSLTHQGDPNPILDDPRLLEAVRSGEAQIVSPTRRFPHGWTTGSIAGQPYFQLIERQHRSLARMAVVRTWPRLPADSIVLVSDVDEIPAPEAVGRAEEKIRRKGGAFVFEQRFHSTRLTLLHPQQPWLGTIATTLAECAPQQQRNARGPLQEWGRVIRDGGWHLSWFGTDEDRDRKLRSFSHGELVGDFDPAAGRANQEHSDGQPLRAVPYPGDYDWPAPLHDGFPIPGEWL